MADLSTDIVVIGAGVLGLTVAVELTARGRHVCVVDPGDTNASSVAAGMIAPAFESVLDGADPARAELFRAARGLWPAFAGSHGLTLDHGPAEWRGPDPDAMAARLCDLGFRFEHRAGAVAAPEDVRIDPPDAMARLLDSLGQRWIRSLALAIKRVDPGWTVLTDSSSICASHVVVATGVGAPLGGLSLPVAQAIRAVRPIAGQIGVVAQSLTDRVLRGPGGYVVPAGPGTLIGATMVEGQRPALIDAAASVRLIAQAEALIGRSIDAAVEWRAAVRGATPDGLPLAGSVGESIHLALAPRRNGWLLAPLVARTVADGIEGRPCGPNAAALDPLRFSPREG